MIWESALRLWSEAATLMNLAGTKDRADQASEFSQLGNHPGVGSSSYHVNWFKNGRVLLRRDQYAAHRLIARDGASFSFCEIKEMESTPSRARSILNGVCWWLRSCPSEVKSAISEVRDERRDSPKWTNRARSDKFLAHV